MAKISTLLSLPLAKWSRDRQSSSIALDWKINGPSILLPGSVVSGHMILTVLEDATDISSFVATLRSNTIQKQPFRKNCADCKTQDVKIGEWDFMSKSATLPRGKHEFPFSITLPKQLPASIDSSIISISYKFEAKAYLEPCGGKNSEGLVAKFKRDILILSSSPIPRLAQTSSYMFQSTGIEVTARFDRMIDPLGTNQASFKMYGLLKDADNGEYSEIWRFSKGSWKLEECITIDASACKRHILDGDSDERNTAVIRTKSRTLASKDIYDGHKAYDRNGVAELNFTFGLRQSVTIDTRAPNNFDASPEGAEVVHSFFVKLVFIKELVLRDKPESAIRTGIARIMYLPYRVMFSDQPELRQDANDYTLPFSKDVFLYPPSDEEDIKSTVLDY